MKHLLRLLPFSLIALLAGCGVENLSALDPRGPVAEMQLNLIQLSLYVMIFVIVVVFSIYTFVLIKFRERPGDTHIPKQVHGNRALEFIWTTIPILLLLILAVPNIMDTFTLAETPSMSATEADGEEGEGQEGMVEGEDFITVQATAHQFWWEFEYPNLDINAGQDLYIPTDRRVEIVLEASDVVHSFWVPALGGKMDNVPGITNEMWLEAPEEGIYFGKCTELCGASHWLMDFKVVAVDGDTFDVWAANMAEPDEAVVSGEAAGEAAVEGREVFESNCISCHAVGDEGSPTGPNFTNFGERQVVAGFLEPTDENLHDWIRDPQSLKPDNEMPAFSEDQISDDEMDALIDYITELKVLEED
ncbi:cytochrome c oxidase subunit II [Alkalicoccus urumqiensis]|uniref:Cytochrome c oxidase subunit 2 n=1 Tax=Alkalicoccus urumqiensis TaxID=1548213 RepID=A0A2P6MER2_ALKUR|nr:cytochrome c oxidase subunit II [Alkalicoccus urumqiensis]PRO64753.1 cytochrome c oxidase subunit II [Alkalicoccus urumqiensis]